MADEEFYTDEYEQELAKDIERKVRKKSAYEGQAWDTSEELVDNMKATKKVLEELEVLSKEDLPAALHATLHFLKGQQAQYSEQRSKSRMAGFTDNKVRDIQDQIVGMRDKLWQHSTLSGRGVYETLRTAYPKSVKFIDELEERGIKEPIENIQRMGLLELAERESWMAESSQAGGFMGRIAKEMKDMGVSAPPPEFIAMLEQVENLRGITKVTAMPEGTAREPPRMDIAFTSSPIRDSYQKMLKEEGLDVQLNPKGGLSVLLDPMLDLMEVARDIGEAFAIATKEVREIPQVAGEIAQELFPRVQTAQGKLVEDPEERQSYNTMVLQARSEEEINRALGKARARRSKARYIKSLVTGKHYDDVVKEDLYPGLPETPHEEPRKRTSVARSPIWTKGDAGKRLSWAFGNLPELTAGKFGSKDIFEELVADAEEWKQHTRSMRVLQEYLKAHAPPPTPKEQLGATFKSLPGGILKGAHQALGQMGAPGKILDTQLGFGEDLWRGLKTGKAAYGAARQAGKGRMAAAGAGAAAAGPMIIVAALQKMGELLAIGVEILKKFWQFMVRSSPQLRATLKLIERALMLFIRPFGDVIGMVLRPMAKWLIGLNRDAMKAGRKVGRPGSPEYLNAYMNSWVKGFIGGFKKNLLDPLIKVVMEVVPVLIYALTPLLLILFGIVIPILTVFIVAAIAKGTALLIAKLAEAIIGAVASFVGVFSGLLGGVGDSIIGTFTGIVSGLTGLGDWLWGGIDQIGAAIDSFSAWLSGGLASIGDALGGIAESIVAGATNLGSYLLGMGEFIWNAITGAITGLGDWLGGFAQWLWYKITDALGSMADWLGDLGSWLLDSITSALSGLGTWLMDALTSAVEWAMETMTGGAIDLISWIPGLAEGGIAMSATPAVIGEGMEPEAVIPLSNLQTMLDTSGGGGGDTYVELTWHQNAPIYGVRDLETAVSKMLDGYFRTKVAVR